MPAPSIVSAQDINNEVGNSSTAQIGLNDTRPRNLTNATGAGTVVSYGACRWGINFRGGEATSSSFTKIYNTSPNLNATANDLPLFPTAAQAICRLTFRANGQMSIFVQEVGVGQSNEHNSTWLTSGAAGDYTVEMSVTSGSWDSGTVGTPLAMSSDRTWEIETSSTPGFTFQSVTGSILINDSGGRLMTRPYFFQVSAESVQ